MNQERLFFSTHYVSTIVHTQEKQSLFLTTFKIIFMFIIDINIRTKYVSNTLFILLFLASDHHDSTLTTSINLFFFNE